jgi:hypothetical protein
MTSHQIYAPQRKRTTEHVGEVRGRSRLIILTCFLRSFLHKEYVYIYIYRERERERERDIKVF